MVTILEPRETVPVESAPAPEKLQPRTGAREWCFSMPFAGVRYFSFRPSPRVSDPIVSDPVVNDLAVSDPVVNDPVASPQTIKARLIDERVILL